ncbi:stage V sporulation protein AD [Lachnospiraceae bacterium MD1]|uniref:Stage V sporulation protein AD n=1 Tax=Variimorphobacter saccharofermentans TaxID=2755051 RepID=A0A839JZT5_9FIRM|nr:stage V sporulation protein AD [Variimorphobacter saccharofermentans]MBB2181991.1 stage V sporulation protein AD [Variimorphobacter saccharofermentans]
MSQNRNNQSKMIGKQSIAFQNPPCIIAAASVAGKKEGEGPLGKLFDVVQQDPMFGKNSWEEAESELMKQAAMKVLEKAGLKKEDIRYLIGGDLLGQLIATSFGVAELSIPLLGIYGACSTMGEAMSIGAMLVDGGFADKVLSITSSHFAGAEKQFRFPLDYGNQRPYSASWTVTGSGAVIIATRDQAKLSPSEPAILIKGITTGKIVDFGIEDSMNMGAAMAPSAFDTIRQNFEDFQIEPSYYDRIITGDLGYVGKNILIDLLKEKNYDISNNYMDCGIEMFDKDSQDTHAGGSGCGCSAVTFTSYILKQLKDRNWKRVLFVPTGALLSQTSFNEGQTVPGIAHAVMVEAE